MPNRPSSVSVGEPGVRKAGAAMGMLIKQFSQPLACLRELVQNAIDAGSNQVEVSLTEVEGDRVCLAVRDTGEGMNRRIIETQLTRLFASAKDGDLTKVGKFGIGFVSVFSLKPLAVVVDTGREGEFWRILFHPDQSYELLSLSEKVEGTSINIYLARRSTDFQQKLRKVDETLRYWCKHCRVEVVFNGRTISLPFKLGLPNEVTHEVPGTRMAIALTQDRENFAGFYNQGLTLLEGVCSPIPFLSFKVDSRYFEHTLTRDNVIENEDYTKALNLIRQTIPELLAPQLYARLRSGSDEWPLLVSLRELGVDLEEAPLVPDLNGQYWSLKQIRGSRLYHQAAPDPISAAVHDPTAKRLVLASGPAVAWLQSAGLECQPTQEDWGYCQAAQAAALSPIVSACQRQLKSWKLPQLKMVRWQGEGARQFLQGALQLGLVEWKGQAAPKLMMLDVEHRVCRQLLQLHAWSPPLATQVLLQHYLLLLPEARRLELAPRLTEGVLAQL